MDEYSAITDTLLEIIQAKLNTAPSSFKLWFGDLRLVALDGTTATFVTSSEMKRGILLSKYIGVIKSALTETIGFEVNILIKNLGTDTMNMTSSAQNVIFAIFVIAVPVCVLIAGIVIWILRRNK